MNDEITDSLEGIELTDEGKIPQKELLFVTNEDMAQALDDPVRFAIITILKRGMPDTKTTRRKDENTGDIIIRQREIQRYALSVVEIVNLSSEHKDIDEITKNQVYHHLPKLIDAGYVIKFGTLTTGKRTTDYYRRTAQGFVLTVETGVTEQKMIRNKYEDAVKKMERVFDISLSDEERGELVNAWSTYSRLLVKGRPKVAGMIKGDVVDKDVLDIYDMLVKIHAMNSQEFIDINRRIRELIFKDSNAK